ncbi:MAG: FGGY family carbohydrate kinase [Candidatus Borkfalkiaceae bacterium]|nr:FGGY family carbohydrate kinase [Clostridia bacterium]MDY6223681.1 FGGY family carbohydrate kinase [Christensenellaceae bacterium]
MYVLGVDFGGGASKATLLNEKGEVAATAVSEYPTYYGAGGKAEQNPEDWYNAACKNIREVLRGVNAEEVKCLCFDAATHTAVLLNENGEPVCNSVYWTDTRCVNETKFLEERYGEEIFKKCKHRADTIWSLPELMYVKNNFPQAFAKVKRVTFAKDYVRGRFTGDFITDYIEAQGSMLFDFDKRQWDETLLSLAGLTRENMPQVVSPLTRAGRVCGRAARDTGLSERTEVICGSTDTVMEVFAAGGVNKGDTTLKLATAGRICVVSDTYAPDKNVINYSHLKEGLYYPGSATKSCAASLRWLRDTFGGSYEEFSAAAETIPVGADGLTFHPYLTGELTPYGNPALRGGFTGLSAAHTKAHFVRAVMEGVALSLLDCITYLNGKGVKTGRTAYVIGGGAKSAVWRQIVADALNLTLIQTENNDSSFGSAMCAGIYAGFFKDFDEASAVCKKETGRTVPVAENTEKYAKLFKKYKKIAAFLAELCHE